MASTMNLFATPADELLASRLPSTDGHGLTRTEFFRINGFGNRARVAYAAGMPDADAIELARVERQARQDGLRAVLRDRPVAAAVEPASGPCCDHDEPVPCSACVDGADVPPMPPAIQLGDDPDGEPREMPPIDPESLLTLPELIGAEAKRLRRFETGAHDLMAKALEELLRVVRMVDAMTPGDVDARLEVLERDYSGHWDPSPEIELTPAGRFA